MERSRRYPGLLRNTLRRRGHLRRGRRLQAMGLLQRRHWLRWDDTGRGCEQGCIIRWRTPNQGRWIPHDAAAAAGRLFVLQPASWRKLSTGHATIKVSCSRAMVSVLRPFWSRKMEKENAAAEIRSSTGDMENNCPCNSAPFSKVLGAHEVFRLRRVLQRFSAHTSSL